MYSAPSVFYQGRKMPYFHVRISQDRSAEFVVIAPDRETAENIAMNADAAEKFDTKKIVPLGTNTSSCVAASTTDKAAWTQTLKQYKAK